MQSQPLSAHYMTNDEGQIKTMCVVINIQLEIAKKMAKCSSLGLVWGRSYNWMISLFSLKLHLSWSRCFLALYNLAKMHLDLTFGGSWLNFPDTCPIKILLEGFYTRVLSMGTLFMVIFQLIRPAK